MIWLCQFCDLKFSVERRITRCINVIYTDIRKVSLKIYLEDKYRPLISVTQSFEQFSILRRSNLTTPPSANYPAINYLTPSHSYSVSSQPHNKNGQEFTNDFILFYRISHQLIILFYKMSSASEIPFSTFALTSKSDTTPSPTTTSFTLHPSPTEPTDVWRKPPHGSKAQVTSFNAPIIYKKTTLKEFKRVRATVTANFNILYDQGGLVLVFDPSSGPLKQKWIKTGVEHTHGKPFVSTVTCDNFADWSLTPSGSSENYATVTFEMEKDPKGGALWIYVVEGDGKERKPIREVTWILDLDEDVELWVGVYAATPIMEGRGETDGLEVKFENWELDLKS